MIFQHMIDTSFSHQNISFATFHLLHRHILIKTMRINNVHITGCNPSEIRDRDIMSDTWDWSHLPVAMQQILRSNQKCSVYFYGTASCVNPTGADYIQAPVLTAIVLPTSYGPPTVAALRYNNQSANDELLTFDYLGYSWKESDDPWSKGRVFYLAYDPESSSVPDSEEDPSSYDHEYSTLYLPRPKEFKTDKNGKLIIDQVTFSFKDAEGETDYKVWDGVKDLDGFIGEVFDEHFKELQKWNEDLEVDEEATKKYLKEVSPFASTEFFVSLRNQDLYHSRENHLLSFLSNVGDKRSNWA
jgi:hypothetical protein